jgi:cell division septum initiation protein DivIVA
MPDESAASSEHALLQEITAPLANLPANPVPSVADVEFPIALRGYDRMAVDAYVRQTSQLVAELQATRSPENAVRRALERVGEEVSDILKRAHDTASQITAQSRSDAEDRLEAARQEAADATAGAEQRLRELDSETDRIWAERHRIVEDARTLAEQLLVLAESAVERFPADEEAGADRVAGDDAEAPQPELFDGDRDVDAAGTEPAEEAAGTEPAEEVAGTEPAAEAAAVEPTDDDHDVPEPGDVDATRVMPTFEREDERSA